MSARTPMSIIKVLIPAFLSLFASGPSCAGQTTVVDVKDESVVNCPVRLSGTIKLKEWEENGEERTSYVSRVSVSNLSNQPIIAMVTYTIIGNSSGPLIGENHHLDAFFAHDLEIAPEQTATRENNDSGVFSMPVSKETAKTVPAASSQLVFVQFADGSTCGDAKDGRVESLMSVRADRLLALKKIDDAAKIDESKFLEALAEKSMDRTGHAEGILNYIRDMQKERGSTAAMAYIRRMLDVAASR
jgi:hypothetical protein